MRQGVTASARLNSKAGAMVDGILSKYLLETKPTPIEPRLQDDEIQRVRVTLTAPKKASEDSPSK